MKWSLLVATGLSFSVVMSACGRVDQAATVQSTANAAPKKEGSSHIRLPRPQTFNHVTGWAFVTRNGEPYDYRYPIYPGPGRFCQLEMGYVTSDARPYNGETYLEISVTYFDPILMENNGAVTDYIALDWKPTASRPTPFYPGSDWKSTLANGRVVADVSYDSATNTTNILAHDDFMFAKNTRATFVTTPDHKKIKSLKISFDWDRSGRASRESNRLNYFECTNE